MQMLVKSLKKDYNIIYVDFRILTMLSKKTIYLTLYVDKRILVFYYCYVKEFLFFIINNNKTMLIIKINALLIEECQAINYRNILTI